MGPRRTELSIMVVPVTSRLILPAAASQLRSASSIWILLRGRSQPSSDNSAA